VNNDKKLQCNVNPETEMEIKKFWEQNLDVLGRNKILEMFCPQVIHLQGVFKNSLKYLTSFSHLLSDYCLLSRMDDIFKQSRF